MSLNLNIDRKTYHHPHETHLSRQERTKRDLKNLERKMKDYGTIYSYYEEKVRLLSDKELCFVRRLDSCFSERYSHSDRYGGNCKRCTGPCSCFAYTAGLSAGMATSCSTLYSCPLWTAPIICIGLMPVSLFVKDFIKCFISFPCCLLQALCDLECDCACTRCISDFILDEYCYEYFPVELNSIKITDLKDDKRKELLIIEKAIQKLDSEQILFNLLTTGSVKGEKKTQGCLSLCASSSLPSEDLPFDIVRIIHDFSPGLFFIKNTSSFEYIGVTINKNIAFGKEEGENEDDGIPLVVRA